MKELNEIVCDPRIKRSNLNTIAYIMAITLGLVLLAVMPKASRDDSMQVVPTTPSSSVVNPELRSVERYRVQQSELAAELVANSELKVLNYAIVDKAAVQIVAGPDDRALVYPEAAGYTMPITEPDLYNNPELKVLSSSATVIPRDETGSLIPGAGR